MWNWVSGEGEREESERVPVRYWTAWPDSVDPPVGAKMSLEEGVEEGAVGVEAVGSPSWGAGGLAE